MRKGQEPLDVWNDDLDAYLASFEDLIRGGHGIWYLFDEDPDAILEANLYLGEEDASEPDAEPGTPEGL